MAVNDVNEARTEDVAKMVMVALGTNVNPYSLESAVDWDLVAGTYGERFRNGSLCHYPGSAEYDDNNYYMYGEAWLIAAEDVENPGRVVAECMLTELRERKTRPNSNMSEMYSYTMGEYLEMSDKALLLRKGIVVVFKNDQTNFSHLDDISFYLDPDEREEFTRLTEYEPNF